MEIFKMLICLGIQAITSLISVFLIVACFGFIKQAYRETNLSKDMVAFFATILDSSDMDI